jgi:hypothetical protein
VEVAGRPDADLVLPTPQWPKQLEQLNVHNFRGLPSPGLAVNQPDVEFISHAYPYAHELFGSGRPSIAEPSRKYARIERELLSRARYLRPELATATGDYEQDSKESSTASAHPIPLTM